MALTASATVSLTVNDGITGNTAMTKSVAGLAYALATENVYQTSQLIGTTPVSLTLPVTPVPFFYLRNTATAGSGQTVQVTITPTIALTAPSAPTLGSTAGGTLGATTYYVKITYVNAYGETIASSESNLAVLADNLLTVTSPTASGSGAGVATGYNVYVGTASNTEQKQNATVIPIGTNWTEPISGLVTGATVPTSNTAVGSTGSANIVKVLGPQSGILLVDPAAGYGVAAVELVGNQANVPVEYIAAA